MVKLTPKQRAEMSVAIQMILDGLSIMRNYSLEAHADMSNRLDIYLYRFDESVLSMRTAPRTFEAWCDVLKHNSDFPSATVVDKEGKTITFKYSDGSHKTHRWENLTES